MVTAGSAAMLMSGAAGPAAFVDLRSIGGLSGEVNRRLAEKITQVLNEALGVPADRVFLNFTDVKSANWGWNGGTFG